MRAVMTLLLVVGCAKFDPVNGESVPTIGSDAKPPTCADACKRLAALCGYAPASCTAADASGYCDTTFDDAHLVCVGRAPTCQKASECQNAPGVDAGADASDADTSDAAPHDAAGD